MLDKDIIMESMKDNAWAYYTDEEKYWSEGGNTGFLPRWITPSRIYKLSSNEISKIS